MSWFSGPSGSVAGGLEPHVERRVPDAGSAAVSTIGTWLPGGLTVIRTVSVPVLPVRVGHRDASPCRRPAPEYVWAGLRASELPPSPNSHR